MQGLEQSDNLNNYAPKCNTQALGRLGVSFLSEKA
jgi:hypothetical protein